MDAGTPPYFELKDYPAKTGTSPTSEPLDAVRTLSKVENRNYYEKNGLRTEGDGVDHTRYNTKSIGFIMTVLGCAFALTGSQIVTLLYFTLETFISHSLNASSSLTLWLFAAATVASGSLAPFVGPLADLYGRKTIFLLGIMSAIIGSIICAATPTASGFIAGQCLLGFGSVIEELLALAVVSEIVPTAKRSLYAAMILCMIIPWAPGTLYANMLANVSWRWIGCLIAIWNVPTFIIIAYFYRPPPRVNSLGLSRREMIRRIDFVGGLLLTTGLLFFLTALNWGGQLYPWRSARVLAFLVLGICLVLGFGVYEWKVAPYPMFPRRMIHAPRPFYCLMVVIYAAGITYVPLVGFWPVQSISVFGSDHSQSGINTLPIGMCILGGAIISAVLIGIFKRHVTLLMTSFCVVQTIATACLSIIDPHDIRTAWAPLVLGLMGIGGVIVPNQIVITIITPDDLIASVTALTVGLRSQAQVVGLAIFYNQLVTHVTKNAFTYIVPAAVSAGIFNVTEIEDMVFGLTAVPFSQYAANLPQLDNHPGNYTLLQEATVQCFSHAFPPVYRITIAFGVVACVAAAFMGDISKYMDNHVAVVL